MRYLIVNQFALPPYEKGPLRHFMLSKELVKLANEVVICSSNVHYLSKVNFAPSQFDEQIEGVNFLWIKTKPYTQGLSRLINHLEFAVKMFFRLSNRQFDIVVGSSPQPFSALAALIIAKIKGAEYWYEVRDFWPLSLSDLGLMSKFNPIYWIFLCIEKICAKNSDRVICLMPLGKQYFLDKGIQNHKLFWAPNFADFGLEEKLSAIADSKYDLSSNKIRLGYFGSHTASDGIKLILKIAKRLSDLDVEFHFYGDGPEKSKLVDFAISENISNAFFHDLLPKTEVYKKMAEIDICLVVALPSPLYKWGLSFNKIFDYFLMKKAILFIGNVAANPVDLANSGLVIKHFELEGLENETREFLKLGKQQFSRLGLQGYEYCKRKHSLDEIVKIFI